jgi:hypothetical protein
MYTIKRVILQKNGAGSTTAILYSTLIKIIASRGISPSTTPRKLELQKEN